MSSGLAAKLIANTLNAEELTVQELKSAMHIMYLHNLHRPKLVETFVWHIGACKDLHAKYFNLEEKKLVNTEPFVRVVLSWHGYDENISPEKTSARYDIYALSCNRCIAVGNYRLFQFLVKYKKSARNDEELAREAAFYGHLEIIKQLRADGYIVQSDIGWSAISGDRLDVLKYAQTIGYDLSDACLSHALEEHSEVCAKYIIEQGFHEFPVNDETHTCDLGECDECNVGIYDDLAELEDISIIRKLLELGALKSPRVIYICAAKYKRNDIVSLLLEHKMRVPRDALRHCADLNIIKQLHAEGAQLEYVNILDVCAIVEEDNKCVRKTQILFYLKKHGIDMLWPYYECVGMNNFNMLSTILRVIPRSTTSLFCDAWDAWLKYMKKNRNTVTLRGDFGGLRVAVNFISAETDDFTSHFTDEMAFACVALNRMDILDRFWPYGNTTRVALMLINYNMFSALKTFATARPLYRYEVMRQVAKMDAKVIMLVRNVLGYCPQHQHGCTPQMHVAICAIASAQSAHMAWHRQQTQQMQAMGSK